MEARTVLVIDDDPVIVKLLQVNFEMEGYAVIAAENGASGLARARDDQPDLIILDVMMPGMNGLDVARLLRKSDNTAAIPIILLSAKAQANDVALGLEVADDYITKPFDPLELLDRVAGFLDPSPSPPPSPPQSPQAPHLAPPPSAPPPPPPRPPAPSPAPTPEPAPPEWQ